MLLDEAEQVVKYQAGSALCHSLITTPEQFGCLPGCLRRQRAPVSIAESSRSSRPGTQTGIVVRDVRQTEARTVGPPNASQQRHALLIPGTQQHVQQVTWLSSSIPICLPRHLVAVEYKSTRLLLFIASNFVGGWCAGHGRACGG